MSKKVLVISSSPRRGGNSDTLCDEFIRGASESGSETEKIFLRDLQINYCTGCGVCNSTHKCVQPDDMAQILAKMVAADVIVFATPIYFYTMAAQLKTLIDRSVPRYTEIKNKDFYFIMTCADTDSSSLDRAVSALRGFTEDCLTGTREKGIVCGTGAWQAGDIKSSPAMREAYEMGKNA
jgi:multimeric flavodoxin WrbA